MDSLKLKINNDALQKLYGEEITVNARNGKPIERYWRNRLKDAELDSCVEVVSDKKQAKAKATTKGEQ